MGNFLFKVSAAVCVLIIGCFVFSDEVFFMENDSLLESDSRTDLSSFGQAVGTSKLHSSLLFKTRSAEQWEHWLHHNSSLRGSSFDGGWGVVSDTLVIPNHELRRRFDYFLTLQGELSLSEIREMVHAFARRDVGEASVDVMNVWDKYLYLLSYPSDAVSDDLDASQLLAQLNRDKLLRRRVLGDEWAHAFFSAEEAYLERTAMEWKGSFSDQLSLKGRVDLLISTAPQELDVDLYAQRKSIFGEDVAVRLAAVDQEQKKWLERVSIAEHKAQEIANTVNLSKLQKDNEFQTWIDMNFSPSERLRVYSLVRVNF